MIPLNTGLIQTQIQTPSDKFLTYLSHYAIIDFGYITNRYLLDNLAYVDVRSVGQINGVQILYDHVELLCIGSGQGGFRAPAEPGDSVLLFSPRFGFTNTRDKALGTLGNYSTACMKAILVSNYAQVSSGIDITRDGKVKEWASDYSKAVGSDGNVQEIAKQYGHTTTSSGATEDHSVNRSSTLGDDGSYTSKYDDVLEQLETKDSCSKSYYNDKRTEEVNSEGTYIEKHNNGSKDTYTQEIDNDGNVTLTYSGTYSSTVTGNTTVTLKGTTDIEAKGNINVNAPLKTVKVTAGNTDYDLGAVGTLKVGNTAATVADIFNDIFNMLVQTGAGLTASGGGAAQGSAITLAMPGISAKAKLLFPDITPVI